tara:strand:- start:598 stop:1713 length:1116 start_codon:yes stop_codon:yes gene_type:complete
MLDLENKEKERRLKALNFPVIKIVDVEKIEIKYSRDFQIEKFIIMLKKYSEFNNIKSKLLIFSSGSTGIPKIIAIDKYKLLESYVFTIKNKSRRILLLLLTDHIGGLNTILSTFFSFDTLVLPRSKENIDIVEILKSSRSQILPGSPTFLNMLLTIDKFNQKYLNDLRIITYGTEKMPHFVLDNLKRKFPKVKLIQTFGTSETGIVQMRIAKNNDSIKFSNPKEFKIVNNVLYLKSSLDATYLNSENKNSFHDGWFNTGDLVKLNEDGSINITGRVKHIINVGGKKVTPQEIENIVGKLENIEDVLCYPIPNPITNQCVALKVKAKPNGEYIKLKKSIKAEFLNYEKYKRPVLIEFVDKIPYSQRGKKIRN